MSQLWRHNGNDRTLYANVMDDDISREHGHARCAENKRILVEEHRRITQTTSRVGVRKLLLVLCLNVFKGALAIGTLRNNDIG